MNILKKAQEIIEDSCLCNHCLGRQFAMLLTGTTNDERGKALKMVLAMQGHLSREEENDSSLIIKTASCRDPFSRKVLEKEDSKIEIEEKKCSLCGGFFQKLDRWVEEAEKKLEKYELESFLVGTRIPNKMVEKEENFWTKHGASYAEPMKREINREVGRRLEEKLGREADFKEPEIVAILNLDKEIVEIHSNPLYIYGRYRKLVRGIPQTEWPCHVCKGKGCMRCEGTGYLYRESVEELIRPNVIEATEGKETIFHGCGREDIDAKMLGEGRPFVIEVKEPVKRILDFKELQQQINKACKGKVEVLKLEKTSSDTVKEIKTARPDKIYRIQVETENVSKEKLKEALERIEGKVVQRTPDRVSHRRPDKEREREIKNSRLIDYSGDKAWIEVKGEAGLYVKELIHGDSGRTDPSLKKLTGSNLDCLKLDVLEVDYRRSGKNG